MPDRRGLPGSGAELGHPLRRTLLGQPLPTSGERREHLDKRAGLAVLSGDALGSVAYATEAMVRVLIPVAGIAAFSFVLPLSSVIIALLATLVFSYRQTIKAYPSAGGAYVVTRDNFPSPIPQIAATGLLLDYVLTAAVSVSAGIAAVTGLIVVGLVRLGIGGLHPLAVPQRIAGLSGSVGLYLILHAYASGTT